MNTVSHIGKGAMPADSSVLLQAPHQEALQSQCRVRQKLLVSIGDMVRAANKSPCKSVLNKEVQVFTLPIGTDLQTPASDHTINRQ